MTNPYLKDDQLHVTWNDAADAEATVIESGEMSMTVQWHDSGEEDTLFIRNEEWVLEDCPVVVERIQS